MGERRALKRLAGWSLQWTSKVSLQPPCSLLLEIGGSLRYFGGLKPLRDRLHEGLEALGYRYVLGVAPTPTAACLLARAGREDPVTGRDQLEETLAGLSTKVLDLDEKQHEALANLGLHTLGDCLALPRGAFARRLGPELLRQLDQARGRLAEPRRNWSPPHRFRAELELQAEVHDVGQLLFALNRLILELCGYLRGIESGTQRLEALLHHRRQVATRLSVGLLAPSRDSAHLRELVRERLDSLRLSAPVIGLSLTTRSIQHLEPCHRSLIGAARRDDVEEWRALVERLSARLGESAVQGLRLLEEHRPERAWAYAQPGWENAVAVWAERPLWLLPRPVRLETREGRPVWSGPLMLHHGPERIESGWWDGADVARDYYAAANAAGERVWIYRDRRRPQSWYLHGVFA